MANLFDGLGSPPQQDTPQQPEAAQPTAQGNLFDNLKTAQPTPQPAPQGTVPEAKPEANLFDNLQTSNLFDNVKEAHKETTPQPPAYQEESWWQRTWEFANTPIPQLDLNKMDKTSTGWARGLEEVVSSFATPANLALMAGTLGAGPVLEAMGMSLENAPLAFKIARGAVTAAFTTQQVGQLVSSSGLAYDALMHGDNDKFQEYAVQAAAGLAGTALAVKEMNARAILPKNISKVLTIAEKTSARDVIYNTRLADLARAADERDHLETRLNTRLKEFPAVDPRAIALRVEFPEQSQIESARNTIHSSGLVPQEYKDLYATAAQLTPEHLEFIRNELRDTTTESWQLAHDSGLSIPFLVDYMTHVWKPLEFGKGVDHFGPDIQNMKLGRYDTKVGYAKSRVFNKFSDGLLQGRVPETLDPVKLAAWQRFKIRAAIINRTAVDAHRNIDLHAEDGRPIAMMGGTARRVADENSGAILLSPNAIKDRYIPQKYVDQLGPKAITEGMAAGIIEKHNAQYYYTDHGYVDIDHPAFRNWQWMMKEGDKDVLMNSSMRIHPAHVDSVLAGLGMDRSALRENKFTKALLDISSVGKSLVFFTNPGHFFQEGARLGLMGKSPLATTGYGIENPQTYKLIQYGMGFMTHNESLQTFGENPMEFSSKSILDKIPYAGKANSWLHENLWNYVNNIKAKFGVDAVRRIKAENPDWGENQVYTRAAQEANNRFGGQNMAQLGLNKSWRDAMQLGLLAPDWFLSEVRSMVSLVNGGSKITAVDMAKYAAFQVVAARVLNLAVSGKARWDHPFGVVNPGDGKRPDQVYSLRSLPGDVAHFISDPRGALYNRLNPATMKIMMEVLTRKDRTGRPVNTPQMVHDALQGVAPLWLSAAFNRPEIGDDWKTKLLKSAAQMGGIQDYTAHTAAEQVALQFSYNNAGSNNPEAIQKHIMYMRALDGLRAGTVPPAQVYKEFGKAEGDRLMRAKLQPPLQAHFAHLNLKQALDVWDVASAEERKMLRYQLASKKAEWLTKTPMNKREGTEEWDKLQRVFPELRR